MDTDIGKIPPSMILQVYEHLTFGLKILPYIFVET